MAAMSTYTVTGPDGKDITLQGPKGASDIDIKLAAMRLYREAAPEPDLIDQVEEFGKGIPAGALGFVESAALGVAAALPEEYETPVRDTIKNIGAAAQKPFSAANVLVLRELRLMNVVLQHCWVLSRVR